MVNRFKIAFRSFLPLIAGVLLLGSCERAVIPESRFADIYHDILLADAYIGDTPGLITSTDSLVAYQGIIEKHGFSVEQFIFAQNFYIAHPDKFSKMMKSLQSRFRKETKEIMAEMEAPEKKKRADNDDESPEL